MTQEQTNRLKKIIVILIAGFLLLFLFRLAYGYTRHTSASSGQSNFFESFSVTQRNYASKKYEVKSSGATQSPMQVDQKYEKIAEIHTTSSSFDSEEKEAREKIESHEGLIQFEQKSGNTGRRQLHLLIGVPPEHFDSLYQNLSAIGNVQAKRITKKDKTNEYRELNAKKASLEKIRDSLLNLKSKGGRIQEFIQLENRILEIEQQLQNLGVSLGDFDNENEFCTVRFSLIEGKEQRIHFMHRLKVALEWTIKYYLALMATLFFITFSAWFALLIIEKLRIFELLINRKE